MSYKEHALTEFRAAGWIDENGKYDDEMQEAICLHILKLLEVFSEEGHSGSSAPYAINLFSKLANHKPIVPLTGEDWEWIDVSFGPHMKYQNKRCTHVFKGDDGRAWDGDGVIFYTYYTDEDGNQQKSYYTNKDSRVYIEFPYMPSKEYVEVKESEDK